MISIAYAAEAGAAAAHGAWYEDTHFLVMVAFIITIALVGKTVYQKISAALDVRSEAIRTEIEEATRLREEAQELLASYERKQRDAAGEATEIAERARKESEYLVDKAAKDLEELVARRQRQATDRIAQAEVSAHDEIRAAAIDVALEASRRILSDKVSGKKGNALIDAAIDELPSKLH
ncbi:MAG: F0F1 ATP synthase subunit B [Rhodospirillaceae bacterium]|jgi:F-type H+-transporting ATPase subunit b|nr:F0F1 ATP synthase subunit B [Rhodospirillaceae bacterium]MBT5245089.1 F0F1 ATP synthase subunit B [Rhodospirillaceae bacterium]MBT5562293.1 F0F1 ATP synthase subunit B [Rhodospirillaceae bacterium]MBT6242716.1 F0F1 ATP synthase subunit B [Rhodospirillaceae bacterium]MBT7137566.1 F0F1 ATP synthase subunit B [Rhodospirillaceae bacterium]